MHIQPQLAGSGMGNWFTEAFNFPGNVLQTVFPSLVPGITTEEQQAVLESRMPPAPETEAKQTDWTVKDLWEAQAQRGRTAAAIIGAGGSQTPSAPPVSCEWYETFAPSDTKCHFGSVALFVAVGGGLAALLLLRRT